MAPRSNRRSEGGASDDVGVPQCPDCLWCFATGRRLSVHRRNAHPEEYYLENVTRKRKKACWEHEEMVLLARQSLNVLAARGKVNVNQHLAEAFPNRTLEAIKGVRKRLTYNELLTVKEFKYQH